MKKYYIALIFTLCFILFAPSYAQAKSAIKTAVAPGMTPESEPVGKIILYDDNTIAFHYGYRVNGIVIKVCANNECNSLKEAENQSFVGNSVIEFDISSLLNNIQEDVEYKITATGIFKKEAGLGFESVATLETKIESSSKESEEKSDSEIKGTEKVLKFVNDWIIPGVYVLLVATLLIKAILLTVDIVRYSDNSDIRSQKIHAFAYLFVGLVCVAVVNSCVGFITGLFG